MDEVLAHKLTPEGLFTIWKRISAHVVVLKATANLKNLLHFLR